MKSLPSLYCQKGRIRKFLIGHGFRTGAQLFPKLDEVVVAVLCTAMRNCRRLDKWRNRRKTIRPVDLPPFDVFDLSPSKRERRLQNQVAKLRAEIARLQGVITEKGIHSI